MSGWIIQFNKPLKPSCIISGCKRKHYAKGLCKNHYYQFRRGGYCLTGEQYFKMKLHQQLKGSAVKETINKSELPTKHNITTEIGQRIKEAGINEFCYQDIMNLTGWKYERVKKHILRLVKLGKITFLGNHAGGKKKQAIFKHTVTGF